MVEVIGQDESVAKLCSCRNCGARLRYYKKDVKPKRVSCMGDVDTEYFITCPSCSIEINVGGRW